MSQQLQQEYNQFKSTLQQLAAKISELEGEAEEHRLVLETLQPVAPERRCLRMVGGVLVDKTVADVVPALEETKAGLDKAVGTLRGDLKKTESELDSWKTKHNVKVVST